MCRPAGIFPVLASRWNEAGGSGTVVPGIVADGGDSETDAPGGARPTRAWISPTPATSATRTTTATHAGATWRGRFATLRVLGPSIAGFMAVPRTPPGASHRTARRARPSRPDAAPRAPPRWCAHVAAGRRR